MRRTTSISGDTILRNYFVRLALSIDIASGRAGLGADRFGGYRQRARGGVGIRFTYHPDPVGTRSLEPGEGQTCHVCRGVAHLVYRGPVYSPIADEPTICARCIENGRAASELDAVFTNLGGDGWGDVPPAVKDEVLRRTPGYAGWQQELWQAHCDDAMAFLGPAGHQELESFGPDAVGAMREALASWGWGTEHIDEFLHALERDGEPTAYVFRCRHCGAFRAYADFT